MPASHTACSIFPSASSRPRGLTMSEHSTQCDPNLKTVSPDLIHLEGKWLSLGPNLTKAMKSGLLLYIIWDLMYLMLFLSVQLDYLVSAGSPGFCWITWFLLNHLISVGSSGFCWITWFCWSGPRSSHHSALFCSGRNCLRCHCACDPEWTPASRWDQMARLAPDWGPPLVPPLTRTNCLPLSAADWLRCWWATHRGQFGRPAGPSRWGLGSLVRCPGAHQQGQDWQCCLYGCCFPLRGQSEKFNSALLGEKIDISHY